MAWVGFELLHASSELGISQRRVDWFIKWTTEIANSTYINMSWYEEGLGRIMFVPGALEYEKPFLGPLLHESSWRDQTCPALHIIHPAQSISTDRSLPSFSLCIFSRIHRCCSQGRCAGERGSHGHRKLDAGMWSGWQDIAGCSILVQS